MATGLVKWWRARFLAGYKPFSVVGVAEGSDSEELLATSPCNSTPPPVPPRLADAPTEGPNPTPPSDELPKVANTRQLSFEEFECDVSVAEGNRRRQEFSFTLYDFDGHGKITKDDIAGLVTTIYDTLGASIEVPPCGSKTIKVKLTVSPDKSAAQDAAPAPAPASCCHAAKSCPAATRRTPRKRFVRRTRAERADSHSDDDDAPATAQKDELRRRVGPSAYLNSSEGDVSDDSDGSAVPTRVQRKRSGSMQRQQLLEIIQANMEKNNLSFHASRKRHQSEQPRAPSRKETLPHATCEATAYHKPVREFLPSAPLPKLFAKGRGHPRKARNSLSPNNDALGTKRNNLSPIVTQNLLHPHTPNVNNVNEAQFKSASKSSKKHQLKHATREQDQARAMAQVVRWLEREFTETAAASNGRRHVHEHIHHHYHHYQAEALV